MLNSHDIMRLDLKSLQYFVRAAETSSFSQAALSFGVAQSVLSRQIAQLEALLKGPLFFRTGRGVSLTELGERTMPQAIDTLRQAGALLDAAASYRNQPEGVVHIGLLPGICSQLLSRLVPFLMREYPGIRLSVVETHSGEIELMLADGRIDIGFYNRYRPMRNVGEDEIHTRRMFLVAKKGSEALKQESIKFADLTQLPLVIPRRPNSLRGVLEEIAAGRKLKINVVLEVNPSFAMNKVLLSCDVYTILPSHALNEDIAYGSLARIPITHPSIQQTLYLEATSHHPLDNAAKIVLHNTRRLMEEIAPSFKLL